MKQKKAFIFIALGLLLALFSVASSGAVTTVIFDRSSIAADAVTDSSGILALNGFSNENYVLNEYFQQIGTISNNSNQLMDLILWIDPDIIRTQNKNIQWTLTIRLVMSESNYRECIFTGTGTTNPDEKGTSPTITIPIGQTLSVTGKLVVNNKRNFIAQTSFRFEADCSNGLNIVIRDTATAPRRQTYNAQ